MGDKAADEAYLRQLSAGLRQVAGSSAALHPVCDAGGDKVACVRVSRTVANQVDALVSELRTTQVPDRLRAPNDAVLAALELQSSGFRDRTAGLQAGDDQKWQTGNDELKRAESDLRGAIAQFPGDANPANY